MLYKIMLMLHSERHEERAKQTITVSDLHRASTRYPSLTG